MWPLLLLLVPLAAPAATTPTRLLRNADGRNAALSGVGRLAHTGVCTAFLIRPRPGPQAPVYVLSNGHCVLGAAGNQVETNIPTRDGTVTFEYFFDARTDQQPIRIKSIPYGTLKGLDVAVLELDTTWESIGQDGIRPLELAALPARAGDPVYTVGAPVGGIQSQDQWLRRSACTVAAISDLAEGVWQFHEAMRLFCGGITAGASGSPLLDARSHQVVGIVNTSNQGNTVTSGDFVCFANNPCELTSNKGTLIPDAGYALPITAIDGCFEAGGRFNLRLATCPLDPGDRFTLRGGPFFSVRPGAEWNVTVDNSVSKAFRYKTGPQAATNCRDERGYSGPLPLGVFRHPIPAAEGRYVLCLVGDGQPARYAAFLHTAVDATPPVITPRWEVLESTLGFQVRMFFAVPDLSNYSYKFGPEFTTDCDAPSGYRPYLRVPVQVPAAAGLTRFCILGGDRADNFTRPAQILLGDRHPLAGGLVKSYGFEHGPVAPASWVSLFFATRVPEPMSFTLRDSTGAVFQLFGVPGFTQQNLFLPADLAPGPAELSVPSPIPSTIRFQVARIAPGILVDQFRRALGECRGFGCSFVAGGLPNGTPITLYVAGQPIRSVYVGYIEFRLPADFPHRGLLPLQVEAGGIRSNTAYFYLPDEGI